jgi:hypothetical protein
MQMQFVGPSHTTSAVPLKGDQERASRGGALSRTPPWPSSNNAGLAFAASNSHGGEKVETTLGDLIVALTEETHRFINDERETYELVAYLLSERLTRRPTAIPKRAPR